MASTLTGLGKMLCADNNMWDVNDAPPLANVPNVAPVFGAFPDCILSKLNSDGPHHAAVLKRRIADYCGVAYKAVEVEWVADIARQVEEEVPDTCVMRHTIRVSPL